MPKSTRRHISEDTFHSDRCENLKPDKFPAVLVSNETWSFEQRMCFIL
jgi:hypothetical protein